MSFRARLALVAAAAVALAVLTASFVMLTVLKVIPFWFTAVVLSRDAFLALGTLLIHMVGARIYPRPTWFGKWATFLQVLTVLVGLIGYYWGVKRVTTPLLWLAAAFTLISGLQYLVQGMRFLNAAQDAEREESHERLYLR